MISELTRKRLRESHLGKPGYWKGKKRPDISRMRKGMKFSEEHRKKIGDFQRGKKRGPHSEETRRKIALRLKGNKNSLNKKHSKEQNLKQRQRMLGTHPTEETRLKFVKRMIGKKGILSPRYIDGRTPEIKSIRSSIKNKQWKIFCMNRDNYTCQKTGIKRGVSTCSSYK